VLDAWAGNGYVVVAPLHIDSEVHPLRDSYEFAASLPARLDDFTMVVAGGAVREALAKRNITVRDDLIAAGHSYGALIAQAAAGVSLRRAPEVPPMLTAARGSILGVVALSPPPSRAGHVEADDWAKVALPMLVVTGTTDFHPGVIDDWRSHLDSFEAAVLAPAYSLVYKDQDHYFNGAFCRPVEVMSESAAAGLASLLELSIGFMNGLVNKRLPTAAEWRSLSGVGVEARVSAVTEQLLQQQKKMTDGNGVSNLLSSGIQFHTEMRHPTLPVR
jgi:dienelactone hydrolase